LVEDAVGQFGLAGWRQWLVRTRALATAEIVLSSAELWVHEILAAHASSAESAAPQEQVGSGSA
jgi:hypothetical protein